MRKFLPVYPRIPLACPLGRLGVEYSRYRNDRLRLWDLEGWQKTIRWHWVT